MIRARERGRGRGGSGLSIMDTALIFGRDFKVIGDSRTEGSSTVSVLGTVPIVDRSANYGETDGMISWAVSKSLGRIQFDPGANFGVSGDDTAEILARIAAIVADPAHNAVVLAGANDRGSANFTLQQSIDNIDDILDALLATSETHPNGHRVYLCTEMPYESLTGTQLSRHTAFRDYLRTINRPNVHIVETWTAVATSSTANEYTATYDRDGLHPTPIGYQIAAENSLVPMILRTVPARGTLLASDSVTGVLNSNYAMAGTGGTGVAAPFTGSLATGWVAVKNAAYTGITITLSKETRADGFEWQKVVLSGTPDVTDGFVWFYDAVPATGIVLNDLFYGAGRVEYQNLSNVVNVSLEMLSVGITKKSRTLDGFSSTRLINASSNGEQIQVLPLQGYATGATSARITLNIKWGSNASPVTGTIWFRDMTAREAAVVPMLVAAPAITGTAQVGQTLTASTGTWQGTQSITYAYQWKADGVAIVGANSSTYAVTSGELGKVITCTVTATNSAGSTVKTTSATAAVTLQYVTAVKRYSVTIASSTASNSVAVDAMDSRSLIFVNYIGNGTSQGATNVCARLERTSDTSITIRRNNAAATQTITAEIEIWYATSSLVESVQYGAVSLAASASGTATITSVDTSRTSVVYLGMQSDNASQSAGRLNSRVDLTNATTVTGNTSSANPITGSIAFMAIQWAAAAVSSVQNITLTTTSASATEASTITSVDVNRSLVFHGGQSGALAGVADLCYTSQLTAATTVTHTRVGTATTSRTISRSIVQFVAGVFASNIQRGTIDLTGVTSNTATITNVGTTKGFSLFNGWRSASTGANPNITWATETLTNGTTVTGTITSSGNTTVIAYAAGQLT